MKNRISLLIISILIIGGLNSACTIMGPVFQSDPTTTLGTLFTFMPSFPTRTFKVEGGSIALQALALQNPGKRPNSALPSLYMIKIRNETKVPLWFTVAWTFPNSYTEKKSEQVAPRESYAIYRKTTRVVADKKIHYSILVFTDEARAHNIGEDKSFMYFNLHEVEVYRKSFTSNGIATINGLQGIKPLTPLEKAERLATEYEQAEAGLVPRFTRYPNHEKDLSEAEKQLQSHINNHPNDVEALILAARIGRIILLSKGIVWSPSAGEKPPRNQHSKEHDLLNRVLAIEPNNAVAHYWHARVYGIRSPAVRNNKLVKVPENLSKAIHHARRAVELNPENLQYREALALYLVAEHRFVEAMKVMRVANDENQHPIYRLLADFQSFPFPDDAIYLTAESESHADQQLRRRRIRNYPQLRVRVYTIPRPASEVLAFYRHLFPDIQFVKKKNNTIQMFAQIFKRKEDSVVPTKNIDWRSSGKRVLENREGIIFSLVELKLATEDQRRQFKAGPAGPFSVLFLVNLYKIR